MSKSPYHEVADLVNQVLESKKQKNLKSFVYRADGSLKVSTQTFAIVSKILQNVDTLQTIQEQCRLSAKNKGLLYVLLFELLMSPNRSIRGGGALKRMLMKQEATLRSALMECCPSFTGNCDFSKHSFPHRFLRVNKCKTNVLDVIRKLKEMGVTVYADQHVPDLLVVPASVTSRVLSNVDLTDAVILQDKSSCFPALCLIEGYSDAVTNKIGDCLDACAAPGNKTSHLIALLQSSNPKCTVYALDRDKERCSMLQHRMEKLLDDRSRIIVQHKDFLSTDPLEYSTVTAILLDPSCSGSGIYGRAQDATENRIGKLSNFQTTMLKHAMSFPNVTRIVYSTCSVHFQENEAVVSECLANNDRKDWQVVTPICLQGWKHRGQHASKADLDHPGRPSLATDETEALIRVGKDDDTNGFFVCCLQRKVSSTDKSQQKAKKDQVTSWCNPNEKLGIPFYCGEFSEANFQSADEPAENDSNHDKVEVKDSSILLAKKLKTRVVSRQEPVTLNGGNPIKKKKAKKLDWKRRQREQKLTRLHKQPIKSST